MASHLVSWPAASDPAPAMTPGRYLRLRREAAHVTVELVAAAHFVAPAAQRAVAQVLEEIEADQHVAGAGDLRRLREIYPFDPWVYAALVAGRRARICASCGCTQLDACTDDAGFSCAWAGPELCSSCEDKAR